MKTAVIDLGSNSARIGIYVYDGKVKELTRVRYNTRLAEGLEKDNLLKDVPMERTVEAFVKFKELIDEEKCGKVVAVSTESLRRAENSDVFIKKVKEKTGIEIEIIDGASECRYGAIAASMSTDYKSFYVLDVGGGSFELSKVKNGELTDFICLPYGCVVVSEKFKPDTEGPHKMNAFLKNVFDELKWLDETLPVVSLGGSAKEIARAVYKDKGADFELDGKSAEAEIAYKLYDAVIKTPVEERHNVFGMEKARADIINAGLATIVNLLKKVNAEEIVFCTKSIREGVAQSILCPPREN